jgi:hypothetical protein
MSQNIKDLIESMFPSIQESVPEQLSDDLINTFKEFISKFNSDAIIYCIDKYIEAEFDFITPGNRGIGRMTENIPRFGAYFRNSLSKLSNQELNELHFFIQDLCIRGYLSSALFISWPSKNNKLSNKFLLFKEWIPKIYITNPYDTCLETLWDIVRIKSNYTIIEIHYFLNKHGMEKRGFFNRNYEYKVNEILEYYIVAGYTLRSVEEGFY